VSASPSDWACATLSIAATAFVFDDPRKARTYLEAIGSEALQPARKDTVHAFAGLLTHHIVDLYDLDQARYATRLNVVAMILFAGLVDVMHYWLDGSIELTREELLTEMAHTVVGAVDHILRSDTDSPPGPHP
jgi:hypothetical protein